MAIDKREFYKNCRWVQGKKDTVSNKYDRSCSAFALPDIDGIYYTDALVYHYSSPEKCAEAVEQQNNKLKLIKLIKNEPNEPVLFRGPTYRGFILEEIDVMEECSVMDKI